jgi:hypothetical protein
MNFIKEINIITRKLNNLLLDTEIKNRLRKDRLNLMKKIIKSKKFNRNEECFLLPRVTPDIYINYNLAIVGNSSRLSRGKYGIEIDNHKKLRIAAAEPNVVFNF